MLASSEVPAKIFRSLIPTPEQDIESSCAKTRDNRGRLFLRTCVIGTRQLRHVKRSLYAKCSGSENRTLAPAHNSISQVSREEGLHDSKAETNQSHHLFPTTHLEVPDKEPRGYGEEEICYDAEDYDNSAPDFPNIYCFLADLLHSNIETGVESTWQNPPGMVRSHRYSGGVH